MSKGIETLIYPVNDLAKAKALYSQWLGVEPYVDEAYYVGFKVDGQEVGLDPRGHRPGPVGYLQVDDINKSLKALLDAGAEAQQGIRDVGGGRLIASVKDGDGNVIGLMQSA